MDNGVEKSYQKMYYLNDEACAGIYTEDELAMLMTHSDVANSFRFIGNDADVWQDDEFRHRVCDKALVLIKQREKDDKIRVSKQIEEAL